MLRAKQKIKAFVFAPRPAKGSAATLCLALGNNAIEVRTHTLRRLPQPCPCCFISATRHQNYMLHLPQLCACNSRPAVSLVAHCVCFHIIFKAHPNVLNFHKDA